MRISVGLISIGAALVVSVFACGGDDHSASGDVDAGSSDGGDADAVDDMIQADHLWDQITECGLDGFYVVTEVDPVPYDCLGAVPTRGTELIVDRDARGMPRLSMGRVEVYSMEVSESCGLSAVGCELEDGSMTSLTLSLTRTGSAIELDVEPTLIEHHRGAECPASLSVSAERSSGCRFAGRYDVTEDAALTAGDCSLEWPTATIEVEPSTFDLSWGSDEGYEAVEIDQAACEIVYENGWSIYNGVTRTTAITLRVTQDEVSFVIEDALDELDAAGNTCTDAVFEAEGSRHLPGGNPLGEVCESEPYVCGNDSCDVELGEGCGVCSLDCGCESDETCWGDPGVCKIPCDVWDDQCPSGTRCVFVPGDPDQGVGFNGNFCEPVLDERTAGESCESTRECAAGLVCVEGQETCWPMCRTSTSSDCETACLDVSSLSSDFVGGCVPYCTGPDAVECGAEHYCATVDLNPINVTSHCRFSTVSGQSRSYCYVELGEPADLCSSLPEEGAPVVGTPCGDEAVCPVGLLCLGMDCAMSAAGTTCDRYMCSQACDSDDDCSPEAATCWDYCLDL